MPSLLRISSCRVKGSNEIACHSRELGKIEKLSSCAIVDNFVTAKAHSFNNSHQGAIAGSKRFNRNHLESTESHQVQ